MDIVIFSAYLLFFSWLINRIPFVKKSGLNAYWITGLFLAKVTAGLAYGLYYHQIPDYENQADTWRFYYDSVPQTKLLLSHPKDFFTDLMINTEDSSFKRFFSITHSFWSELKHVIMVKLMALFNVLSGSRYYTNVIFYSFITFFGPVSFMIVLNDLFPNRKLLHAITIFLFPSFLFWASGIHKEGLLFLLIAIAIYSFYFGMKNQRSPLAYGAVVLLCCCFIFLLRNYLAFAMLPFFVCWWVAEKYFTHKWIPFFVATVIGTILFFTTKLAIPVLDAPAAVMVRKHEFEKLGGNSRLPQRKLTSSFYSFLKNAPQALNHSIVRPYITEIFSPFYFICAIEILMIWILVFIWYFRYRDNLFEHSLTISIFFISFSTLLIIGYIVPQLGAIVRYRSIFIPLLAAPIVSTIRWNKHIK